MLDLVGGLDDEPGFQVVVDLVGQREVDLILLVLEADEVHEVATDEQIHRNALQVNLVLTKSTDSVDRAKSELQILFA